GGNRNLFRPYEVPTTPDRRNHEEVRPLRASLDGSRIVRCRPDARGSRPAAHPQVDPPLAAEDHTRRAGLVRAGVEVGRGAVGRAGRLEGWERQPLDLPARPAPRLLEPVAAGVVERAEGTG